MFEHKRRIFETEKGGIETFWDQQFILQEAPPCLSEETGQVQGSRLDKSKLSVTWKNIGFLYNHTQL